MVKNIFSPMELDALGEMMNISLGSSATAVSNMLEHQVNITTPQVSVVDVESFELGDLEPALGVQIKYVEGLTGSNILLLKKGDVKVIVDILLGTETPDEEFELNELTISAVCEVMNQMMGSSATALSDFLGFPVNISTPETLEMDDVEKFKKSQFPKGEEEIVVIRFSLKIEDALESEFMNVISVSLAKELLKGLGIGEETKEPVAAAQESSASSGDKKMSQEDIEKMMSGMSAPAESSAPSGDNKMSQEDIERMMSGMSAPAVQQPMQQMPQMSQQMQQPMGQPMMPPYGYPPQMYYAPYGYQPAPEPKVISTSPLQMSEMQMTPQLGKEQSENLDLIMEVPLQVTVEIGRTSRKVQDILEFSKGTLVVLDKLAGDHVDLFVNGKCIAKGDVVVVDDNFGVRITEIVQNNPIETLAKKK